MNSDQTNEKGTKDPNGLLKIGLMALGFVALIVILKYILDILNK